MILWFHDEPRPVLRIKAWHTPLARSSRLYVNSSFEFSNSCDQKRHMSNRLVVTFWSHLSQHWCTSFGEKKKIHQESGRGLTLWFHLQRQSSAHLAMRNNHPHCSLHHSYRYSCHLLIGILSISITLLFTVRTEQPRISILSVICITFSWSGQLNSRCLKLIWTRNVQI